MPSVKEILETMDYGPAPEAAGEVLAWLAARSRFGLFIDGAFTAPGETVATMSPATGAELAQVTQATAQDIAAATAAARAAAPLWAGLDGHGRGKYLYALARHLQKRESFFRVLEVLDTGKTIRETRDSDLPQAIRQLYHHAGSAEICAETFPGLAPLGVVGTLLSRHAPLVQLLEALAPALAAGNCIVLKPSPHTPLSALAFAELCVTIGLPKGVVNIVTGDDGTGAALAQAEVDKIAVTGAPETGRQIRIATAGSGKALRLSLAGPIPVILCADADLDAAIEGIIDTPTPRLLVAEAVAETIAERLAARWAKLRIGDPLDKCTDSRPRPPLPELITFRTPAEAVEIANTSRFGLAASVWSENITLANDIAARLAAGVVWINSTALADAAAPFGGRRDSGFGRHGGQEGMRANLCAPAPAPLPEAPAPDFSAAPGAQPALPQSIDRTAKLYIGGAQKRPDSGHSYRVTHQGVEIGLAPLGSRKDIRNAVEAAHKAAGWSQISGHARAQVLFFLAENLSARQAEFEARLASTGHDPAEVAQTIRLACRAAALADKIPGESLAAKPGMLTCTRPEPLGVIGIACANAQPLLGLAALVLPAIALGNRVVALPAASMPFAASDLAQVLDTSDVPGGVVNLVTGPREDLAQTLAAHEDVAAVWYAGTAAGAAMVERESANALKPTWCPTGRDWACQDLRETLAQATQMKTVWTPYGM